MLDIGVPLLLIALLILVNGFFVAAEFAVAGASRPRMTQLAQAGSPQAQQLLHLLNDPQLVNRYLSTAQIGITIASLGLGMYGEHTAADWLLVPLEHLDWLGVAAAHTLASVLAVALLTYLHVVLGEMIPKSLALQSAAETAVALYRVMHWTEWLFRPLTYILNHIGNALLRLLGVPQVTAAARLVSTTELTYIVEESSESGLLEPREQVYLENVIDFNQRTVSQVMTPRTRMVALPINADLTTTLRIICEERHSRYPVYKDDRDHIIGILHVKDLARQLVAAPSEFDLRALLRPAVFVPESITLDAMLAQFRSQHVQIAIVLDEYGGTAGLVALEDLAEEIIGEIQDEFDEDVPPFTALDDHTLRVRGDLLLDELTQHYDLNFAPNEAETIGGLIMSALDQVASQGDQVVVNGVHLIVESMEGLAIHTVILRLPRPIAPATSTTTSTTTDAPPATAP